MLVDMEFKVDSEKENPFFKRKDLQVSIKHIGVSTPSKAELAKELAEKYKVDETQVQIKYILAKRGLGESVADVKILKEKPKVEVKQEAKVEGNEAQASTAE